MAALRVYEVMHQFQVVQASAKGQPGIPEPGYEALEGISALAHFPVFQQGGEFIHAAA